MVPTDSRRWHARTGQRRESKPTTTGCFLFPYYDATVGALLGIKRGQIARSGLPPIRSVVRRLLKLPGALPLPRWWERALRRPQGLPAGVEHPLSLSSIAFFRALLPVISPRPEIFVRYVFGLLTAYVRCPNSCRFASSWSCWIT